MTEEELIELLDEIIDIGISVCQYGWDSSERERYEEIKKEITKAIQ